MILIPTIALGALILGFLVAPVLEVKLTNRIVQPILVAGLFFAIALMMGVAASCVAGEGAVAALGVLSGILGGLGLFLVVVGCARLAMSQGETEESGAKPKASKK
jgi:hypothetical protein